MDPDANLEEQRILLKRIIKDRENDGYTSLNDISRLLDLVSALDEWISKGGFLPKQWKKAQS